MELVQDPKVEAQEPNLVEPEAQRTSRHLPKGKSSKPKKHGSYMANYSSHTPRILGG